MIHAIEDDTPTLLFGHLLFGHRLFGHLLFVYRLFVYRLFGHLLFVSNHINHIKSCIVYRLLNVVYPLLNVCISLIIPSSMLCLSGCPCRIHSPVHLICRSCRQLGTTTGEGKENRVGVRAGMTYGCTLHHL